MANESLRPCAPRCSRAWASRWRSITAEQLRAQEQRQALAAIRETAAGVPASKVRVVLALMKELGVVAETRGARFELRQAGLLAERLEAIATEYSARTETDRAKRERMMMHAQTALCRWKVLLEYFGTPFTSESCGHCDNCRRPVAERIQPPAAPAVAALPRPSAPRTSDALGARCRRGISFTCGSTAVPKW